MSETEIPRPLKGDDLGRVVRLLKRELTDVELRQVLERRYTAKTWRKETQEFNLIPRVTRWNCTKIDEAVIAFAVRMGRWPVERDWGPVNFLPSGRVFRYHDNASHWCLNEWRRGRQGLHLPFWDRIVEHARQDKVPVDLILRIPNQVKRRDAVMAIGGPAKIAEAGHGHLVQQDDYGKLWRINYVEPDTSDWASWFVEVVNSTPRMKDNGSGVYVLDPDPDGNPVYDHYFLRVPPNLASAKEAVAWTGHFGGGVRGRLDVGDITDRQFAGFVAQS